MSWTDERVETVKRMWADGYSANLIAAELGDVTRNAVIGKATRLGLTRRGKGYTPLVSKYNPDGAPRKPFVRNRRGNNPTGFNSKKLAPHFSAEPLPPEPDFTIPTEQRRSLAELQSHHCRWPCGDPATPDFYFCAGQRAGPLSYCAHHARIAYQPRTPRKPYVQEAR